MSGSPSEPLYDQQNRAEDELHAVYYAALGKFISRYANVEWHLNQLVRHYYGITHQTANIIFGALRVDAAFQHITRLTVAGRVPDDDKVEICAIKGQLGQIASLRNDIVHHGISIKLDDNYLISNADWSFDKAREHTHLVSPKALGDISKDFQKDLYTYRPTYVA